MTENELNQVASIIIDMQNAEKRIKKEKDMHKKRLTEYMDVNKLDVIERPEFSVKRIEQEQTTYKKPIIEALIEAGLLEESVIKQARSVIEKNFIKVHANNNIYTKSAKLSI